MAASWYEVLGLGKGASLEEVKVAFRAAALKLHPDRQALNPGGAGAQQEQPGSPCFGFVDVQRAYKVTHVFWQSLVKQIGMCVLIAAGLPLFLAPCRCSLMTIYEPCMTRSWSSMLSAIP